MATASYLSRIITILQRLGESQHEALDAVATRMADTLASEGLVHLFGSGHSVLPTMDAFPRYGSFVGLHPLTDPRLMWHNVLGPGGVRELLWLERTEGYVERFLSHEPLAEGDGLLVFSHGGRNAAPVEAAEYARAKGLWVAGVTAANFESSGRASSSTHLTRVSDLVIDTGVPVEDALVGIDGWERPVGGASTLVAIAVMHELNVRAAQQLAAKGVSLPTFVSPTVPGTTLASNDGVFAEHARCLARRRARLDGADSQGS